MRSVSCCWMIGLAFAAAGCDVVLGTEDLFACETCEGGSGGSGANASTSSSTGTGNTSTGATGSSTGTGTGCFDVTVTVSSPNLEVKLEGPQDLDFTGTQTACINAGSNFFEARCEDGENKGDSVSVTWGNAACADGSTCTFTLAEPQVFTVALTDAGACP